MKLKPGTLVVLEGLDATGKSTQCEALAKVFPDEKFTHQPSGGNLVGQVVYQMTEQIQKMNPLTRQLLHLASHAEHYDREIVPALASGGVFMDRCWWSTIAYGYFGGGLEHLVNYEFFHELVTLPTQGIVPDVVLLFYTEYEDDLHNTDQVRFGYTKLQRTYPDLTHVMKAGPVEEVTKEIVVELSQRGLLDHDVEGAPVIEVEENA